ncbi:hypothetical protein JHK85_028130 [Glycine max]|nr:hypothetical protein JHK85_028130 [Glycine max]
MSWLQKFPLLEESCNKKHSSTELDSLTLKANDLEEKCSLKDKQIRATSNCREETAGQKHSFTFDKVFTPEASQEEAFVEISQLVQSALDGYKFCFFAYGQTGSGKTYTMMGRPGHLEEKGFIPRSLEQIFKTKQSQQPQVSMLEIYNETIRDLISTTTRMENGTPRKQYTIKHDANGNTQVSDLTVVDVHSAKEVAFLLNQPANSRNTRKVATPLKKVRLWLRGGGGSSRSTSASCSGGGSSGKQNVRVVAGRSSRRDEVVQAIAGVLGFWRVRERVFTARLYKLQNLRWCLMTPTLYVTISRTVYLQALSLMTSIKTTMTGL